ncbi:hypothetical protein F4604DRAFT_1687726 [Suillus subluteus]|nr:hypothetical protein F4604DRAFT_1687726 [Suillus subluteus]
MIFDGMDACNHSTPGCLKDTVDFINELFVRNVIAIVIDTPPGFDEWTISSLTKERYICVHWPWPGPAQATALSDIAASCDRHGRTAPGLISKPLQLAISFVLIARFKSLLQEALIPTHWQQLSSITVHWQSILKDEQPTTKVEQSISKVQQSVSNERPFSYGHHWLAISPKGNIDVTVSLYLTKAIVLFNANRHEDAMMHMDQLSADLFVNPLTCGVVVASLQLQLGTIVFKMCITIWAVREGSTWVNPWVSQHQPVPAPTTAHISKSWCGSNICGRHQKVPEEWKEWKVGWDGENKTDKTGRTRLTRWGEQDL